MLSTLLAFEMKYHFKQITFKVAALLFVGLGMLITQGGFGGPEIFKNGPYVISYITCFLSLFSVFVSTLFCANVVLRDTTYEMESIIFTTSIKRRPYFMVRLLGLLLAVFIVLSLAVLGIYFGTFLTNPDQLGAYKARYFLYPLFVFGLPGMLFCSSVIFSVALLTRNMRAVYMAGVGLFILYFLGSILGNSPLMASSLKTNDPGLLPYLVDPFAITAFLGEARSWTAAQRNHDLFPMEGVFLANRLLWTGISILLLLLSYRFFKFRLPLATAARKQPPPAAITKTVPYKSEPVHTHGLHYHYSTFITQLKLEVVSVFKHIPFLVMMALWIFLIAVDLKEEVLHGPYGIRFYAASGFIAEQLRSVRPALLLLVFYVAELIHRERTSNMQGLVFSTPVSNAVLWGAKCATLGVLVATLITTNICIGIGLQLFTGYRYIEWSNYFSLFYYSGLPLFLFAVLIIFIQTVVSNKYLGILLSLTVMGIFVFARTLGIEHYLLRYASLPDLRYSSMNGFGHYTKAVHWYLLYWTSVAAVLSLLAAGLWQGSTHTTFWQRVTSLNRQWGRTGKLLLAAGLLTCISTGIYIYGKTPKVSTSRTSKMTPDWQVAYEKKYKSQAHAPQPIIIGVTTKVDLYPAAGKYTVQGSYRLRNESGEPVTRLWLGADPEVTTIRFVVPHATPTMNDPVFKQYGYALAAPLLPGQEMSLSFSMEVVRSGFMPFNPEHSVVSNGSYIELEKYVPFLGYNDRFETSDAYLRKVQGLAPLTVTASTDSSYHLIDLETTVSTVADQQVVTVGTLQKEWLAGGRHYFHYKTEQPVNFMFALSSARYAVQKETYQGIACNIYYQPEQVHNIPMMMQAMKDAVAYGNTHFSAYPFKQLTLAEIPHYPGAATAYPGVLFSAEKINFMSDYRDSTKFNNTYAVTAHETGHQWWANKLAPLSAPGKAFLTESLAKYTEIMAVEKRFGKMYLREYLQTDNKLYFGMRHLRGEQELPLSQSIDQTFVYYQKGGLTLYAIKEALGEDRFSQSLQRLIAQHAFPHAKAATADLLNELHAAATPEQTSYIDGHLNKVIVYDTRLKIIACEPLAGGRFKLQLQVNILKTDQTGTTPQSLVPADSITLAVFDQPVGMWNKQTRPVYWQQHFFSKAVTTLTIIVDKKPAVVAIDPLGYLLDEDLEDNIREVTM